MYSKLYIVGMLLNHIKTFRSELGLTQQELADKIGVIRQTVIAIEQGKYQPSVVLALRLATVFQQPVEKIFELNESL